MSATILKVYRKVFNLPYLTRASIPHTHTMERGSSALTHRPKKLQVYDFSESGNQICAKEGTRHSLNILLVYWTGSRLSKSKGCAAICLSLHC